MVVVTKMNQVTTRGSADAGLGAPEPPNKNLKTGGVFDTDVSSVFSQMIQPS